MSQITLDIPDTASGADAGCQSFVDDMKMAAVRLYMTRRLSLYQASPMVGMIRVEFVQRMGECSGTAFTQTREAREQELLGA